MALRGRPPKDREDWMEKVAELMVKEHMSFSNASQALGRRYETAAEELVDRYSDAFQNVLDAIGFKFYSRIGDNPMLTKGVLAGVLMTAVTKLGEQDNWQSIHMPGKLLADIMGWYPLADESNRPILANLTQRDIDELKAKAAAEAKRQAEESKQVQVVFVDTGSGKAN